MLEVCLNHHVYIVLYMYTHLGKPIVHLKCSYTHTMYICKYHVTYIVYRMFQCVIHFSLINLHIHSLARQGLPLNTTKNRGRPGRSGDVIGRGLGRGYVSPPTRPRSRSVISTREETTARRQHAWLHRSTPWSQTFIVNLQRSVTATLAVFLLVTVSLLASVQTWIRFELSMVLMLADRQNRVRSDA